MLWFKRSRAVAGCCRLCDQPLWSAAQGICGYCWPTQWLPDECRQRRCPRCGLPSQSVEQACGRCLQRAPLWDFLVAVDDYRPPLSTLINQLKFQQRFELAPTLARLLLLRWLAQRRRLMFCKPDLLLPVPLYRQRQWRRGFNQSALIVAAVAYWLAIDWQDDLLLRIRPTLAQQQLSAAARRRNLRQAFAISGNATGQLIGKRIALIDDVVTTGTTVGELSRLLRAAGASEIQVWSLCRTI